MRGLVTVSKGTEGVMYVTCLGSWDGGGERVRKGTDRLFFEQKM